MNSLSASPASTLSGDIVPRKNPRVAARVVDGKALVVAIDQKQLHALNEVGTFVWQACDGRTLDAIVEAMVEEFTVDRVTAKADVQTFVEQLCALGVLELEKPP